MTRKQSPESLAETAGGLPPSPPARKIDLHDVQALRRELGSVYRAMRSGEMDSQRGSRCAYVLDLLRKFMELGDLQARIEALERRQRGEA